MTAQENTDGAKERPQSPRTLWQFLVMVVRLGVKSLLRSVPLAIAAFVIGWFIHTYILIGPNGGFARMPSLVGDSISARGNALAGIVIWTVVPTLLVANIQRARRSGMSTYLASFGRGVGNVVQTVRTLGSSSLPLMLVGFFLAIATVTALRSNLLSFVLALCMVSALAAGDESFWFVVLRLGWDNLRRVLSKDPTGQQLSDPRLLGLFTGGASLGFLIAFLMPMVRMARLWVPLLLLALAIGAAMWYLNDKRSQKLPSPPVGLLILMLMAGLALAAPVLADDGGLDEAGGSLGAWLQSEGAFRAVVRGVIPSMCAVVGAFVGTVIGGPVGAGFGDLLGSEMGQAALDKTFAPSEGASPARTQAEARMEQAQQKMKEIESTLFSALDEAKEAYDRLKAGKIEELERIEEYVEEILRKREARAVCVETALATAEEPVDRKLAERAFDALEEMAGEKMGEESTQFLRFQAAAYHASATGPRGAKATSLAVRGIDTQLKTWSGLYPQQIRYEMARVDVELARARVELV